jgi:hypothetical protein
VRRGHVADVVSGFADSVGAFLTEASGDLLAEVVVLGFEALDLVERVLESWFQRICGGTLGGGDGRCCCSGGAEPVDLGA